MVEVVVLGPHEWYRVVAVRHVLVGPGHPHGVHALGDGRLERDIELFERLFAKVFGRRRVAAVQYPAGVLYRHLLDRVDEDGGRLRRSFLGRPVHAQDELVHLPLKAHLAEHVGHVLNLIRERYPDLGVPVVAVGPRHLANGILRGHRQGLPEPVYNGPLTQFLFFLRLRESLEEVVQ